MFYCTCETPVMDIEADAGCRRCGRPVNFNALPVGAVFDTRFETGCVVTGPPDALGNFPALDSDGVECTFAPVMIVRVAA